MADLGSDIGGILDVDAALTTATGKLALAQAILRRLSTPPGGLLGSPTYGYDLRLRIGATTSRIEIERGVRKQVLLEEEVSDARVAASFDARASTLDVEIRVVSSEGPFELTITVQSDLTISAFVDGAVILEAAA